MAVSIDDLDLTFQEKADPKMLDITSKIGNALAILHKTISRPFPLPKIFKVQGQVEVTRQPSIEIKNLNELKKYFDSLEKTFNNLLLAIHSMPQPQVKLPKIEIPAQVKNDNPELLKAIDNLNSKIEEIGKIKIPEVSMTATNRLLTELVSRPVMTPTPVTNIGINGLEGFAKSTQQTVGTTLVELPSYGQLFNRRSMIIFNNSAATTVYIGGSDVTSANGLPVLGQSYSPALDAGYDMQIYGRTASSTADVRVFEVSKDQTANIQE